MRNLTIHRRKSVVGSLMKDQVYIQDEVAGDLVIEGVTCRKLGDLKNGEQKTFQIDEAERKVFLIADKLSKDYCNGAVTVPAGQEDVQFAGAHAFVLGSNPFRFDGVPLSEEQQKKQKKNGRKGLLIFICALVVGAVAGMLLSGGLFGAKIDVSTMEPKTFTKEPFRITLTDGFRETDLEGYFACYESKTAFVFVLREEKSLLTCSSLDEYGQLILEANGKEDLTVNKTGSFLWFSYTQEVEGQDIYYITTCHESQDAYWIVNFATPATNQEKFSERFIQWATTVTLNGDSAAAA